MKYLLVLLIVFAWGCPSTDPPPVIVTDTDMCPAAEQNLLKLQCKDSRGQLLGGPNKKGVSFQDRCKNIQDNGNVPLNPKCLATITSCDQVDPCLQK